MKAKKQEQAFDLFFKGNSIRETAAFVGVSRSSVERWSKAGEWAKKREAQWKEYREKNRETFLIDSASEFKTMSSDMLELVRQSCEEFMQYSRGERTRTSLRFSLAEIARFALVATRCNNMSLEGIMRQAKIAEGEIEQWREENLFKKKKENQENVAQETFDS